MLRRHDMNMQQLMAARQIAFKKQIKIVKLLLMRNGVWPETEIQVYLDHPTGWHATVGAENLVWVIHSINGNLDLDVEPIFGFRKNGCLIRKEKDFWEIYRNVRYDRE
jgi:hypothetical protein